MSWLEGAAAAFAIAVAVHAVVVRLPLPGTSVLKFFVAASLVGAIWLGVSAARLGWSMESLSAALAYGFGCEVYVFVFTLVGNSVAVSLLLTVEGGCRTAADIALVYRSDVMVGRRLDQLVRAGLIERQGERLRLTRAGRRLIVRFDGIGHAIRPGVDVGAR